MSGNTKEKIVVHNNAGKKTPAATAPMANAYANATVLEKIENLAATFCHRKCNETILRFFFLNIKGNDKSYQTLVKLVLPKTAENPCVNRGKRKRNKSITQLGPYVATEQAHGSVATSDDLGLFNLSSQTRRSQTARGQLATRSARWTARVPNLSNQTARDNISSRSDQFQLAVHLFGASAQGVPDPSSDDLGLFNLSSQTRQSQTARVPDLSNQTARDNISLRSDQFQLAVHLFGGPFNPT
ncbi:hypothetical protein F2Q69_00037939 [Brassica cretica]|uniref:Uncharacterized protein n=1 Tax=Brassica cretica TaxID=69181 RepID=A0A8S9SR32_BRACR|nr:hypothetical protein F2Q69_00037939 [Brassica cretica]